MSRNGADLAAATQVFLATLTPSQRAKAVYPFDHEERLVWHYVPKDRQGVRLDDLDRGQRAAAEKMLRTALSYMGWEKVETIRELEIVLQEIENDTAGSFRNPNHYYYTVFGEPGTRGAWSVRYEGHHLSFHWTVIDGRIVASTPQFLGANPALVGARPAGALGPLKGTCAMQKEEELARKLVHSLNETQRKRGIVSAAAPGEILTGARRRVQELEPVGIPFAELDPDQRRLLQSLIAEHSVVQTAEVAAQRWEAIQRAGIDRVLFAWFGGLEPGQGHYYRIQGKTFLIEYVNTQNHANHIHTVWRDFRNDFGEEIWK